MEELLRKLESKENDEFILGLQVFVNDYATANKFNFLDQDSHRVRVWESVFSYLNHSQQPSTIEKCLIALRILSRDKTDLENLVNEQRVQTILSFADLLDKLDNQKPSIVTNEAQKLLCNLLFNSQKVQNLIMQTKCLENVINRIQSYDSYDLHETKFFDVRILFLITALISSTRILVNEQFKGNIHLINLLDDISKNCLNNSLKDDDANLSCEILKTLFNLFVNEKEFTVDELEALEKLVATCRRLLLYNNEKYQESIQSNIVNLITVLPSSCYIATISPLNDNQKDVELYQEMDMTAINTFLNFLNQRLDNKSDLTENLSPILTAFINLCRVEKVIRKYVRMQVLPPLKDVMNRPEVGTKLRNKLCKLLTTPITSIRDLVAEFLFVLCKEKVGRMIKYTGYGNAAGMFATKGLLGSDKTKIDYSSESEDSDTEEYEKYREHINPVIGCYEKPKPNPLEGMTEEQKEYEAMKLVGLVDQLTRDGVIQPCQIGEDGKPKPIEHVLQFQEQLPKQQMKLNADSDSE